MSPLRRPRLLVVLLLVAIGGGWVALTAGGSTARFGDSHDGRNAGVWAEGSRAIREDGLLPSYLGGRHAGEVYADHPPAIYLATAASEAVGGEQPLATRMPAILASLAAVPLLYLVLTTLGASPWAGVVGTAVAMSTEMARTYGTMLDTPVLGLPAGLAVLWAWARRRSGRPLSWWAEGGFAALAGLVAWQAAVVAMIVVVAVLARRILAARALRAADVRAATPTAAGVALGVGLSLLWGLLAYGGGGALIEVFLRRTGASDGMGLGTAVDFQAVWIPDLLGVAVIGLAVAVLALASERERGPAAVLLSATFAWAVLMPDGAAHHSYWLYTAIVPAAYGMGLLVDRLPTFFRSAEVVAGARAGAGALGALVVALTVADPSVVADADASGRSAGEVLAGNELPADQADLPLVGVFDGPLGWVHYEAGVVGVRLEDGDDLRERAATDPDDLVLVSTWCPEGDQGSICRTIGGGTGRFEARDYVLLTAAEAAERLEA